ncbi:MULTISPECIES: hypothetical protein [Bacillus cereus group]|uniref:hypothetical protein n=1 Tax=Bacillus cereus group TaxID=86661 RepID=UPI0009B70477|nr:MULTISPECIES: hypothetical protein [Bacillus cereus group]ARC28590.1 hypothetical protein A6J74_06400 [Bacillus sp. FDAARGOS_235]PEI60254.1 hypothetical protein CN642_17465 [Bacillus toyonensis]
MAEKPSTNSGVNTISDLNFKNGYRETNFRYELLDKDYNVIRNLDNVESANISYSAFANIHRTADFRFRENTVADNFTTITTGKTFTQLDFPYKDWAYDRGVILSGGQLMPEKEIPYVGWNAEMEGEVIGNQTREGWSTFTHVDLLNRTYDPNEVGVVGNAQRIYKGDQTFKFFGIISDRLLSRVVGRTYYYSFITRMKRLDAWQTHTPKVWFVPSNAGSMDSWFGKVETTNHTSEDLGGGWRLWIGSWTMPSGFPSAPAVRFAVGYEDGGAPYEMWIDSVYMRDYGTAGFTYKFNAYSPTFDIDNTKQTNGVFPKIKTAKVYFDNSIAQYNPDSGCYVPFSMVYLRTKIGTSGTWSAWNSYTSGQTIAGIPAGTPASNVFIEANWHYNRYSQGDSKARVTSLKIEVAYDEQGKPPLKDTIDYRTNRIKPYLRWNQGGTWQEAPLGVFMMNSPKRADKGSRVYRDVQGYDLLSILDEAKVIYPFSIAPDVTNGWSKVIRDILTGADTQVPVKFGYSFPVSKVNVPLSPKSSTGKPRIYQAGESWLKVLNDLASCIGYQALFADENGVINCLPYVKPNERPVTKTYEDDAMSVMYLEAEEEYDIYDTPNVFVCTQQADSDGIRYYSRFFNTNEGSLTSIPNVGRYIVDYREVDNIDDQGNLDQYCARVAIEASQAYGKIEFRTALMPAHTHMNAMKLKYKNLAVDDVYTETAWSMDLSNGGQMSHSARKVINI